MNSSLPSSPPPTLLGRRSAEAASADPPPAKRAKIDEIEEWENAVVPTGAGFFDDDEWHAARVVDTSSEVMKEIDRVSELKKEELEGPESRDQRKRRLKKEREQAEKEKQEKEGKTTTTPRTLKKK